MINLGKIYDDIRSIVGEKYLLTESSMVIDYCGDCTSKEEIVPNAVVIPGTANEIADVVKICNRYGIKMTIRGGGSGVSGGAISGSDGIIISVKRLNHILEINKIDRTVLVEAGVVTQVLQDALLEEGLCFPQNISSAESSFIGGNVAVSSGSPKSLKYGPTRNCLLNMEVVLADGELIWTGKNITKNATGYNLTQLFAGSEGTLGIITKVLLQLTTPVEEILVLVPFKSMSYLFDFIYSFYEKGFSCSSMEFIDQTGYKLVSKFLQKTELFSSEIEGLLWIEVEGRHKAELLNLIADMGELIYEFTDEEILVAETKEEIRRLWGFRKRIGDAVVSFSYFRDIDIVVPRSKIRQMYTAIENISHSHNFEYTALGHVGNGNFHVNIFNDESVSLAQWEKSLDLGITEIFRMAVQLGGTISGEHGIGKFQRPYLNLAIPDYQLGLMRNIKKLFDPNNILNPGNIF